MSDWVPLEKLREVEAELELAKQVKSRRSKRWHAACKAMQGLCANVVMQQTSEWSQIAGDAFGIADAMLKAEGKENE